MTSCNDYETNWNGQADEQDNILSQTDAEIECIFQIYEIRDFCCFITQLVKSYSNGLYLR